MACTGRQGTEPPKSCSGSRTMAGVKLRWAAGVAACLVGGVALLCGCDAYDPRSTLQFHLLAKPASGMDEVLLTVASVTVHVAADGAVSAAPGDPDLEGDGHWHSLTIGRSVDLGKATDVPGAALLGSMALPEGWIDQLRVEIKAPASAKSAAKQCDLLLVKVPKAGIGISQWFRPFAVGHSLNHAIWLDMRLDLALGKVGDCWALTPLLEVRRFETGGKEVAVQ